MTLSADLSGSLPGSEVALDDLVARAVVEDPFLPLLRLEVWLQRRVDDHQLTGDPSGSLRNALTLIDRKMPKEVAGHDPVEAVVGEGQIKRIPDPRDTGRQSRLTQGDHRWALVQSHDETTPVPRQASAAASDVESPSRWGLLHRRTRLSTSACQPDRSRDANWPAPRYHSSYSTPAGRRTRPWQSPARTRAEMLSR